MSHRLSIVHRDVKPDNPHLGSDGHLGLLDLAVAASAEQDAAESFNVINNPGRPSYMAPGLVAGTGLAAGICSIIRRLPAAGLYLY